MRFGNLIKIFLFLCAAPLSAFAQYRFDTWTTDNGLPQNGVRSIGQTSDGYLWLTTFDGLVRFDGVSFKVFNRSNSPGFVNNRLVALSIEKDDSLRILTENRELIVYKNGEFASFDGIRGAIDTIADFDRDLNGEFFVTSTRGAFYFRNDEFVPAAPELGDKNKRFFLAPSGAQWIFTQTEARQIKNGAETVYPLRFDFDSPRRADESQAAYAQRRYVYEYSNNAFQAVTFLEDLEGALWTADFFNVYRLKDGQINRFAVDLPIPKTESVRFLRPFVEDDDGTIWLASGKYFDGGAGIVALRRDGEFTAYGAAAGVPSNSIETIFKDKQGNLWIVPVGKGIAVLRKQFIKSLSVESGLVNPEVYPILKTAAGDVIVGTAGGLSRYRDGKFTRVAATNQKLDGQFINALNEDKRGRIWTGTSFQTFVLENERAVEIPELRHHTAYAFAEDRAGNVWAATAKGLFKLKDDRVAGKYGVENGLPSDDVKTIYEDADGTLWFGTFGGLARFGNERFAVFDQKAGLVSNAVRSIYGDANGTLWIGTYDGGLSRFRDGRFFNYTTADGLFSNGVFQIFEDARGNFWMSSNLGIYRVAKQELEDFAAGKIPKINSIAYGKSDGMLATECNGGRQPAGLQTDDGKFWFPTQNGVAVVDPNQVSFDGTAPPVKIETVSINREKTDLSDSLTLRADADNLLINFTGIGFIKPEQIKFRYRLEGLDEDWKELGTSREVYFPFLPAGNFTFRVAAENADGVRNDTGATLRLVIKPPFYRTWWFFALSLAAVGGVGFLIFYSRLAALKRRHAAQEAFSRQLIESQERERKRIAAELHDGLGQSLVIIKNRAVLSLTARDDAERAFAQLDEISAAASEALNEVKTITYDLRPYQLDRLGLTKSIQSLLRRVADQIEITSDIDFIDDAFPKDQEINVYRIVQESVNNVVKHSKATRAAVKIKRASDAVEIRIADNGKGFDQTKPKTGFGLLGLQERARILNGTLNIASVVGEGTTISVRLNVNSTESENKI